MKIKIGKKNAKIYTIKNSKKVKKFLKMKNFHKMGIKFHLVAKNKNLIIFFVKISQNWKFMEIWGKYG